MYVCVCNTVTERHIRTAVEGGASTSPLKGRRTREFPAMNASCPEPRHPFEPSSSRPRAVARVVLDLSTAALFIDLAIK